MNKKCSIDFGLKEKTQPIRHVRRKQEKSFAEKVVREVEEVDREIVEEIEKVTRIGKFVEGHSK